MKGMKHVAVIYLTSYAVSLLGNSIAAIALPLIVLATTGDILGAGVLALATGVPSVLGGLFGGVLIDRINRRTASFVSDLISALAIGALPIIDIAFGLNLGWFILLGALGALGDIPGMTAREAMLPAIVRASGIQAERLMGIREAIAPLMLLVGPGVAGTLMFLLDGSTVLWITAATSMLAAFTTLLMPRVVGAIIDSDGKPVQVSRSLRTVGDELRVGLRFLFFESPFILGVLIINLALTAVITGLQSLVLPAHFTAIGEPGMAGYVLSAIGLGTLIGAGVYAFLGTRGKRRTWFVAGMVGTVLGFAAIALLPATPLILVGGVVAGMSMGPVGALLGVLLIERIPENLRGRVMGSQNSFLSMAPPLAVFGAAVIANGLGLPVAGLVLLGIWVVCVAVTIFSPAFRNLEKLDTDTEEVTSDAH